MRNSTSFWIALCLANTCFASSVFSEPGNKDSQEVGDVVFRELNAVGDILSGTAAGLLNKVHGGIYIGTTLPGNAMGNKVIEMSGVVKNGPCLKQDALFFQCAKEVNLISEIPLELFKHQSMMYFGAFGHKTEEGSLIDLKARNMILQKAYELKGLDIKYIVMPGEGLTKLFGYLKCKETGCVLDSNGKIDPSGIERMRSDAFVEYCYSAAGKPITRNPISKIAYDIRNPGDFAIMDSLAESRELFPTWQKDSMQSAVATPPEITVYEAGTTKEISSGGLTRARNFDVKLRDLHSGPRQFHLAYNALFSNFKYEQTVPISGKTVESAVETFIFPSTAIGKEGRMGSGLET